MVMEIIHFLKIPYKIDFQLTSKEKKLTRADCLNLEWYNT